MRTPSHTYLVEARSGGMRIGELFAAIREARRRQAANVEADLVSDIRFAPVGMGEDARGVSGCEARWDLMRRVECPKCMEEAVDVRVWMEARTFSRGSSFCLRKKDSPESSRGSGRIEFSVC